MRRGGFLCLRRLSLRCLFRRRLFRRRPHLNFLCLACIGFASFHGAGCRLAGDGEICQNTNEQKQRAKDDLGTPCLKLRQLYQDERCKAAIYIYLQTLSLPRTGSISGAGNKLGRCWLNNG